MNLPWNAVRFVPRTVGEALASDTTENAKGRWLKLARRCGRGISEVCTDPSDSKRKPCLKDWDNADKGTNIWWVKILCVCRFCVELRILVNHWHRLTWQACIVGHKYGRGESVCYGSYWLQWWSGRVASSLADLTQKVRRFTVDLGQEMFTHVNMQGLGVWMQGQLLKPRMLSRDSLNHVWKYLTWIYSYSLVT